MKKITILALHLGYGGIEQYISSLCKMLESDYELEIISTYKVLPQPAFEFNKNIKIKYLINDKPNTKELKQSIKSLNIIKIFKESITATKIIFLKYFKNIQAIKNINSDYIITTRIFHNKLVSRYAKKNIIKIATDHNYHNNDKKYINQLINSCNNFDYFIAISKALYKSYNKKFIKAKCVYIPNVIDDIPNKSSKLKDNTIISIGRLSKEKGFDDLISVVSLVKEQIKNIKIHLIGDGILFEELETQINNLELNENIIMHGFLDRKSIEKLLLESSIYVMTSHTESFGLVLVEAMSYGLPIIAFSSAEGAKELINDNGILIDNRDKEKMANKIIGLLKNKDRLKKYGQNGKNTANKYLAKNVKEDWLKLLK